MSVTELVIDRAKWGKSSLHNKDGTMCCLGHLSKACGVTNEQMPPNGLLTYPLNSWSNVNKWARTRRWELVAADHARSDMHTAGDINDSQNLSYNIKEERLIRLFANNGVTLSFIGEHK